MKLAVRLLLALFGVWLLLLPASALAARPQAAHQQRATAGGVAEAVASSVEALPAPPVALRVAPAPFVARLPVTPRVCSRPRVTWARLAEPAPQDARRQIERVQVRRAVPRLNDGEPPWSAAG